MVNGKELNGLMNYIKKCLVIKVIKMLEKTIAMDTILELYRSGAISKWALKEKGLNVIIDGIKDRTFVVTSSPNFDYTKKPEETKGIVICVECGEMYWFTPLKDAYETDTIKDIGRKCEACAESDVRIKFRTYQSIQKPNYLPGGN